MHPYRSIEQEPAASRRVRGSDRPFLRILAASFTSGAIALVGYDRWYDPDLPSYPAPSEGAVDPRWASIALTLDDGLERVEVAGSRPCSDACLRAVGEYLSKLATSGWRENEHPLGTPTATAPRRPAT